MTTSDDFISKRFGVSSDDFFKIISANPGADGYILGAIGEYKFREYAESLGYEVLRIKEKPTGGNKGKSEDARGDFYIRKKDSSDDKWFVVECKSVKSNAEDRAFVPREEKNISKRRDCCLRFLAKHSFDREKYIKRTLEAGRKRYEKKRDKWLTKPTDRPFPPFRWHEDNPGPGFPDLSGLWKNRQELKDWLDSFPDECFTPEAFYNLKAPLRLLQTHMPSTRTDDLNITSTGPLTTEFNILCLDLFLRTGEHQLIFANSVDLNHQAAAPNHLQQNYNIDILVQLTPETELKLKTELANDQGFETAFDLTCNTKFTFENRLKPLAISKPWYISLDECITETKPVGRELDPSQLDYR